MVCNNHNTKTNKKCTLGGMWVETAQTRLTVNWEAGVQVSFGTTGNTNYSWFGQIFETLKTKDCLYIIANMFDKV